MNFGSDKLTQIELPELASETVVRLSGSTTALLLAGFYGFSLAMMAAARVLPKVFTVPFVVMALSFVPGALLVIAMGGKEMEIDREHVLYAFGTSLLALMLVGALVSLLLPLFGVERPLMPIPLGAGVTVLVVVFAGLAVWRNAEARVTLRIPRIWSPVPLAIALVPLLSILGVNIINATGISLPLVLVLLAISAVPLVAVLYLSERWYPFVVWAVALAILYHKSLWQFAGFGGRPHGIQAWQAGRWSPGITSIEPYTSELLQNGVLFPLYARLSGIQILTQYEVINPFFVSFIPLAMYVAFERYVGGKRAFLAAAVFMFAHPFYYQYPTAGRAATPVLFLTLFGTSLAGDRLSAKTRTSLGLAFLFGIVVSHYGTSYYVAAALAAALVLVYGLRLADEWIVPRIPESTPMPDGGSAPYRTRISERGAVFSWAVFGFFASAALGWYMYMRGGQKFDLLPKHIYENILELIGGPSVSGRTAARVQESYSSMSIEVAKYIYITIAVLILLGITVTFYRRIVSGNPSFDDHYLAIATALFGLFGITIIFRNWGGGRPMMISFSFATVFAPLGFEWVFERARPGLVRLLRRADSRVTALANAVDSPGGLHAFATILLVLFVLNTGIVAGVTGEFAPSNVPNQAVLVNNDDPQSQVTVHRQTDTATHVWMVRHHGGEYPIWGDTFGARQYDWYRPAVVARTPSVDGGYTRDIKPEVLDADAQVAGDQQGYLLILGHNLELGAVWPSKFTDPVPLERFRLSDRDRIYDSGESRIYLSSETQESDEESEDSS